MSASYAKAAIPEPHTILGQRLRPFSLGHYLILSRFDSPFLAENGAAIDRNDLIFAVMVCAMDYQEFFDFMQSPKHEEKIRAWGNAVGLFDVEAKIMAFHAYLLSGMKAPKFWDEGEGKPKPSGTHWSQSMILTLTGKLGYTHREVLNCPLTKAISDYLRHHEEQGAVRIMTDEEIALVESIKSQEAAHGA